jgi:hypothetical protein
MSDYLVSGKKGAGKSAFCVGVIRQALLEGKRVATNLNIEIDKLVPVHCKGSIIRIPDRPVIDDLLCMGKGQSGVLEEDNGVLVLDETSSFMNSRAWNDKSRQPLLDWFIHSRKYGWDTYFIAQGQEQLDKQLRTTQLEYHIAVKNTGKWPVPFITPIVSMLFGYRLTMPKMHLGIIRQGLDRDSLLIGRKWFKGIDVYEAYDTQQVFLDRDHDLAVGIHTVLSCYHLKGRYLSWLQMHKKQIFSLFFVGIIIGSLIGGLSAYKIGKDTIIKPQDFVVDSSAKVIGLIQEGLIVKVLLDDGVAYPAVGEKKDKNGHFYKVGEKWLKVL